MHQRPDFPSDFELFVASQSPRRHSLLREIGVPFTVVESTATELESGAPVQALAEANALAKVRGARLPEGIGQANRRGVFVLGTDTLVSVGRRVMGKPDSAEQAAEMLAALSGRTHQVVSGVALARVPGVAAGEDAAGHGGGMVTRSASCMTRVTFADLARAQIDAYVASGEWKGKAGGYAVQGLAALFVRSLRGEHSNVVGLPLHLLYGLFRDLGFDLLRREWLGGRTG